MVRLSPRLPLITAVVLGLSWPRCLLAAEPSVAECVNANETSFKFDSKHQLRAERAQLLICAAASCPGDVRKECLRRVEELNHAIPTVVFDVKDTSGNDVEAVKVWMDDELLSERLNGIAITVDPGEHRFRFESPGRAPFETRLLIRETEKARHQLVTWPAAGGLHAPPVRNDPHTSHSKMGTQRVSAILLGGVGIVGVGIGAGFALDAMSRRSDARSICPEELCPTSEGVRRWHDAHASANVATAAFVIGGIGLAGATVLWLTDRSTKERGVQVGLGAGSLQLKGTW